jgi:hypothetical protein
VGAFPFTEQRVSLSIDTPAEVAHCLPHLQGVGPCRENAGLRAFEFCRRDHFHGFRDFLGFLNGVDLPSDGLKAGHVGYTYLFIEEESLW